jgi:molybdopterin/thiamine biosynthesis adenylyltransferase
MNESSPPDRYSRQVQFGPIGADGQRQIEGAKVAVLGCGALGTVAAEILARAGVGTLRLIDRDLVDWSNLQRQSLFTERDATEANAKAAAATAKLADINSSILIEPLVVDVTPDNIRDVLDGVDLVIDAVDNFLARFLVNDWSLATQTPWVHGGCVGASGQVRLFSGLGRPCLRCVVPEPPVGEHVQTCDTAGVLGAATHLVASWQAAEAIKWLSGNRDDVRQSLVSIDLWRNRIRELEIDQSSSRDCPACRGDYVFLTGHGARQAEEVLCGRRAVQITRITEQPIDLALIANRWEGIGRVQTTRFFARLLLDDQRSLTLFGDGRAVVSGTGEVSEARSLYDRYVGS